MLLELPVQVSLADSEDARGVAAMAVAGIERTADVQQLQFDERGQMPAGFGRWRGGRCGVSRYGKMLGLDLAAFADHGRRFDRMEQLTHIPGPVVAAERIQRALGQDLVGSVALIEESDEMVRQQIDVAVAFSQRWNFDGDRAHAIEEVLAEESFRD